MLGNVGILWTTVKLTSLDSQRKVVEEQEVNLDRGRMTGGHLYGREQIRCVRGRIKIPQDLETSFGWLRRRNGCRLLHPLNRKRMKAEDWWRVEVAEIEGRHERSSRVVLAR